MKTIRIKFVSSLVLAFLANGCDETPERSTSGPGGGECKQMFFQDSDGDGYGNDAVAQAACDPPAGYVATGGDCDDSRADVSPDAWPVAGQDANCDGSIDYDVDGDGFADQSPMDFTFDPVTQRHIELEQVEAGKDFAIGIHDGDIAREGISLVPSSPFSKVLTWNAATGTLSGRVRDPGVYRFPVSICKLVPYNDAECQKPENRRLDLAHLTVRGAKPPAPVSDPAPEGPFKAALSEVSVNIDGILYSFDISFLPDAAAFEKTPEHAEDILSIGTGFTPTRLIYPTQGASNEVAPGQFPLVVLLHGNGYHWDAYDQLGSMLASQGLVVVIPQFPTGLLGACGGSMSTEQRGLFGLRAMNWALEQSKTPGAPLAGHLDPTRVVFVGHSWGGAAAEWIMPRIGMRMGVIFDPISLLNNVQQWENCKSDLVTDDMTPNHLRRTLRDISIPTILLDAGRSGFVATRTEYRGLYPASPLVHASFEGTYHEDFLDPEDAFPWLDTGTCYDEARAKAHRAAVSVWMTRALGRYANDDFRYDHLVHGAASLQMPKEVFPSTVDVATYRPAVDHVLLDRAAEFPYGSSHTTPRPNLIGGTTVVEGAKATIDMSTSARSSLSFEPDGTLKPFSQPVYDYLISDEHREYRKILIEQETAPVLLRETFPTPFDAGSFHMLAVDVWTSLVSATGFCYKSEPDSVPETLGLVLRVISQNGVSAEIPASAVWGSNRMYHEAPFTLMGDLSAIADKVDLKQVTAIEIEVPAGKAPRHIALDEVRLLK